MGELSWNFTPIQVQKKKVVGYVFIGVFCEMLATPFVKKALQSKERSEVGIRVIMENQILHHWLTHGLDAFASRFGRPQALLIFVSIEACKGRTNSAAGAGRIVRHLRLR